MKIKLKEVDIKSNELSWLCIKPMLLSVRGKDLHAKVQMYKKLNEGQQGLYLFYSFHNHAATVEEFYWFSTYYIKELKSWNGIKKGIGYYRDAEMVELLNAVEQFIVRINTENQQVGPADLERDKELKHEVQRYFNTYRRLSTNTINRMNKWIVNNLDEYCELE